MSDQLDAQRVQRAQVEVAATVVAGHGRIGDQADCRSRQRTCEAFKPA